MSVLPREICFISFVMGFSSALFAEECLSNQTSQRIEETVFFDSSYEEIPIHDGSGEENLDIGYSFAQSGNYYIVKHFRPNFTFTFFITKLESGRLIEANFNSYGIVKGKPRHGSYRFFYDHVSDRVEVLCGKANTGALTVDPITNILPDLLK